MYDIPSSVVQEYLKMYDQLYLYGTVNADVL